jgi:hypothetical protein
MVTSVHILLTVNLQGIGVISLSALDFVWGAAAQLGADRFIVEVYRSQIMRHTHAHTHTIRLI